MVRRVVVHLCLARQGRLACLAGDRAKASSLLRPHLDRRRACSQTATSAVVADAVSCAIHNHSAVDIRIADDRPVHVYNGRVVAKTVADPPSTIEAGAVVAKPIIHAAIEAYRRPPVAFMEGIDAATPTPVARCPQQANCGRLNPGSWNPVIAVRPPRPVARCPDVVRFRAYWLVIHRKLWRSRCDRNTN